MEEEYVGVGFLFWLVLVVGFGRMRRERTILLSVLAAGQDLGGRGIKSKRVSMQNCYTNFLDMVVCLSS